MIIDELSSLPLPVQSTDELPIERGELAYKVTYNNLVGSEIADVKSNVTTLQSNVTTLQSNVTTLQNTDSKIKSGIAIIVTGDTASMAVPVGGYAYIQNNTHGLVEGLYINVSSAAFPVNGGTANSSVFSPAISYGGALNMLGATKIKFGNVAVSDMQAIYVAGGTGRYKDITFDGFTSAPVIMMTLNNTNYSTYGAIPLMVSNVTASSARILTTLDVNSADLSVMWVAIGE